MEKVEHIAGLVLFALIALFWAFRGLRVAHGALCLPWIKDFPPAADRDCPRISLIFAARDEEEKLPAALATLTAIDYPNLEIIAVNDRSQDHTAKILDEFALEHERIRVAHIDSLPVGWLGKTHALQTGYERSTVQWLLVPIAELRLAADVGRRSGRLVSERRAGRRTCGGAAARP